MATPTDRIQALVGDAIAKLRLKLLDLTNRNRLLNFKFSPTSRKFVRVIDEIPTILFEKLSGDSATNRKLYFASLPEPPPPEVTKPDHVLRGEAERDDGNGTVAQVRRAGTDWRSRVNLAEWATANGINPSFELPAASMGARRHEDNQIQTLLLADALEKKLSAIREDARLATEELGISTLFAAFGFLEWYEAETSDVAFFAPLLLLPVQIDRDLSAHRYRYFITGSDAAEPTHNVSLKERLKRDFGLDLPALEEGDSPETYADRVSRAIRGQIRWTIHRYVVVGHFSFSRLVMYEDLAPERWPAGGLHAHALTRELLAGATADEGGIHAPEFDVDSDEVEKHVPVLITDADSSQFSAIVDAMQGRSFALKGPPGTGKSQTITNLIAAALASGRRVLFVAEKQAALEVVSKRLGEAGLAPFVLELHSTKANKKRVLESFEERLALKAPLRNAELDEALRCLREARQQLSAYVSALNTPVGRSGMTLHDVYWREQAARRSLSAAALAAVRELEHAASAEVGPNEHARNLDLLRKLARSFGRCAPNGALPGHPLLGIQRPGIGPGAYAAARQVLTAWLARVEDLDQLLDQADRALGFPLTRTLEGLDGFVSAATALAGVPGTARPELVARCDSPSGLEAMSAVASQAAALLEGWAKLRSGVRDLQALLTDLERLMQCASRLVRSLSVLGIADGRPDAVYQELTRLRERLSQDDALFAVLERFLEQGGYSTDVAASHLSDWADAIGLLQQTPPEALRLRSTELQQPDAVAKLRKWSAEAESLSGARHAIVSRFPTALAAPPEQLRAAAEVLGSTNPIIGILKPSYRAAKRLYRSMDKGKWPGGERASRELITWADLIEKTGHFESDPDLRRYAGRAFDGLQTPFSMLRAAASFLAAVDSRWPLLNPARALIVPPLTEGSSALLEALRGAMPGPAASRLEDLREQMRAAGAGRVRPYLAERADMLRRAMDDARALDDMPDLRVRSVQEAQTLLCDLRAIRRAEDELRAVVARHDLSLGLPPTAEAVEELQTAVSAATLILQAKTGVELQRRLLSGHLHAVLDATREFAPLIEEAVGQAVRQLDEAVDAIGVSHEAFLGTPDYRSLPVHAMARRLQVALAVPEDDFEEWCLLRDAIHQCHEAGIDATCRAVLDGRIPAPSAADVHQLAYLRGLIRSAGQSNPLLPRWTGDHIEGLRARLVKLDKDFMAMSRAALVGRLSGAPVPVGVRQGAAGDRTGRALIEHEIGKQRRHVPIRDLLTRAAQASRALKPCFMMSPASVAQFLPAEGDPFDLVIIDEASQMRPEEALGAIGRGRQAIIVGDPMQLPPTAFFDASTDTEDELADEELDIDTESILDLGLSSLRPARDLRWHYRSRHHSLIAFSNREFYRDRLIVFPSPLPPKGTLGVQLVEVSDGIYAASVNVPEADAVCSTVRDLIRLHPRASIGVVALNQPQKDVLTELFDRLFAENDDLEAYRSSWAATLEPFFIKNLENVQGDERDVIVISTVYGRSGVGAPVYQRFGPINSKMGHRRLNVLFTRAKERVVVVTSLRPEDIQLQAGSSSGVRALKSYLQFARSGRLDAGDVTGASAESPFEEEVGQELVRMGYAIEPQVGVAGFFIDLAVRHPVNRDHFLLGIECDGATYHSAKSARDRDRIREEILQRLGWKLYRIWSTDWFRARDKEVQRLKQHIASLLATH